MNNSIRMPLIQIYIAAAETDSENVLTVPVWFSTLPAVPHRWTLESYALVGTAPGLPLAIDTKIFTELVLPTPASAHSELGMVILPALDGMFAAGMDLGVVTPPRQVNWRVKGTFTSIILYLRATPES
jgi:hypothetical protein